MFPEELKQHKRWMCWRIVEGDGKPEKIPYNPSTGLHASVSDPTTWVDYWTAAKAIEDKQYDSIGFVLGKEVGLVIVDFDKVVEQSGDSWPEWVTRELDELDSYTEVSVSGRGLHVLVWGSVPENLNKQSLHVEIHDSKRMFALSGDVLDGRDVIQSRNMGSLYKRIVNGRIGPDHKPSIIAERWDSQKFHDVCNDEWDKHGLDSRSAAVQSALVTLAIRYNSDRDKMREEFEGTKLCETWEEKSKWSRLGESEIEKAIVFVKQHGLTKRALTGVPTDELELDPAKLRECGDHEYLLGPVPGQFMPEGMFPRKEVSLVGGTSGVGKSTILYQLLSLQERKEEFAGRPTYGRSYLIVLHDRSKRSARLTLQRLKISDDNPHVHVLSGAEARLPVAHALKDILGVMDPMPEVVIIEGLDMYTPDQSKMDAVTLTLSPLQKLAEGYAIAIIGTVGSPKLKVNEKFINDRDRVFGSSAWSRKCETIWTMQALDDGRVAVSMMPRHSKPDKITLAWTPEGRFIIDSTVTKSKADEERERRIRHFQAFDADFTVREYMEASGLGDSRAQEFLVQMVEENVLKRRKDGKRWLYRVRGAVEAVDSKETGL